MFDKTSNTMQSSTAHTCRASSPDGSDTRSSDDVPKLSSCASAASTCTWMQNHQHINRVNDCTDGLQKWIVLCCGCFEGPCCTHLSAAFQIELQR